MIAHHLARSTDPLTSHEAARIAVRTSEQTMAEVLRILAEHPEGLTDEEIAARSEFSDGRLRHGRKALAEQGQVREDGRRRTALGAWARVWKATNSARAADI